MFACDAQVLSWDQTPPAQSPQKVVSKTILWFMKWSSMVQELPPSKLATGLPQFDGLGESLPMSDGAEPCEKKKMRMTDEVHSRA